MKWKDSSARKYYSKFEKVVIKNGQGWFDVYRLPGEVFAICELQHFQEVNAYYAHFDCEEFGKSNIADYLKSMKVLLEKYPDVKALNCSHNDFVADPIKISETVSALNSIINDSLSTSMQTNAIHSYLEDVSRLKEYNFIGFSIIIKVKNNTFYIKNPRLRIEC